jgi:integrase
MIHPRALLCRRVEVADRDLCRAGRQARAALRTPGRAAAWALLLSRPLRRGEVAGLRWEAIDFAGATFQIVRTRISVDGKTIDSTPKTGAARRLVPIDASLVALLQAHETRQRLSVAAPERLGRLRAMCSPTNSVGRTTLTTSQTALKGSSRIQAFHESGYTTRGIPRARSCLPPECRSRLFRNSRGTPHPKHARSVRANHAQHRP